MFGWCHQLQHFEKYLEVGRLFDQEKNIRSRLEAFQ